jgi:hypothetical protein
MVEPLNSGSAGGSARLRDPKFAGQLDTQLRAEETLLDTADVLADIFELGILKPYPGLALALTSNRLLLVRARGLLGAKAPFSMNLTSLSGIDVIQQPGSGKYLVQVTFTDERGRPGLWKLNFGGDEQLATRWTTKIERAAVAGTERDVSTEDAEPQPPSSSSNAEECRARLLEFCDSLTPLTSREMIGEPIGSGHGLEQVVSLALQHFEGPESIRGAGMMVAADFLVAIDTVGPDDLNAVMGFPSGPRQGITAQEAQAADSLAGAAVTFLGQFDDDGANIWELWKNRDDVAVEILAWLTIARLRLVTVGKLVPAGENPP